MKAIILSRVSTPEQKEAGNSLPAQNFRLNRYIKEHELEKWKEFEFDETAYKETRKDFSEIVQLLKQATEPVALCCDKIDRLIRNFTQDLVTLEELRKEGMLWLHFPSDNIILHKDSPAADLFRFTIGVSLAKYYSDAISDNVKRAIEQKLRNGEWPGKAPSGYLNIDLDEDKKWIEVDPERADLVIKLFEWYAEGKYSMEMLRGKAKEEGLTNNTTSGTYLTKSQIEHILKNPFYYGDMRYRDKLYPHKYKPLIPKVLFDKVQEVRQSWNKKPFRYAGKPFIYRGLLSCDSCGCRITFEMAKGKYIYGHCTNFYKNCPNVVWIKEEDITDQVKKLLKGLTISQEILTELVDELKNNHQAKIEYHERTMTNLKTEYDKIENRLDKMYEDRLDGELHRKSMTLCLPNISRYRQIFCYKWNNTVRQTSTTIQKRVGY